MRSMILSMVPAVFAAMTALPAPSSDPKPARIMELPLSGDGEGKQHAITYDDGSILVITSFFRSSASGLGVARANVSGKLARDKIEYTDMLYIANGTGKIIDRERDQTTVVKKGDFVILPRGLDMELRDFTDYIHFSATFEMQPNAHPKEHHAVQVLHPEQLRDSDYERQGKVLRHVFYTGEANVQVRAWKSVEPELSTDFARASFSELFFVTAGTARLTTRDGQITDLKVGAAYLIPKGTEFKVESHDLKKLAVVFDQEPTVKSAGPTK